MSYVSDSNTFATHTFYWSNSILWDTTISLFDHAHCTYPFVSELTWSLLLLRARMKASFSVSGRLGGRMWLCNLIKFTIVVCPAGKSMGWLRIRSTKYKIVYKAVSMPLTTVSIHNPVHHDSRPTKFQFMTSQRMDVWRMHHPIPIAHAFHPVLVQNFAEPLTPTLNGWPAH